MKVNTNRWNRIRYSVYQPLYDLVGRLFTKQRKRSIHLAELKPEDHILLLGAGTGLDLELLKEQKQITAIDITPAMLNQLKRRARKLNMEVTALIMDGQKLQFADESFDIVFLHMIIAVIPDPIRCLKEVERVLKPGGVALMFDIFLPDHQKINLFRKIFNPFADLIASDLNRKVKDIIRYVLLTKEVDEKAVGAGLFRIVRLRKAIR